MSPIWRRALQNVIVLSARPYVSRELPGWGRVYDAMVGGYRRDWLWSTAPTKTIRGKRHGYSMRLDLSKWADRSAFFLGRWYDLNTQLLMSDLIAPGDTVVDVGANRGMFALVASRLVGETGRVVCFEPNPNCFEVLDREISSNAIRNIVVHKCGLGEREEELLLSVPRINSGEGTFGHSAYDAGATYQVTARVRRGDDVLSDVHPTLIKIDVEGFECNVLGGLVETIRRDRPMVLTEVVAAHLSHCGASVEKLRALMESLGYRGFKVDLRKEHGKYDWMLAPFKEGSPAFDALWLHADSMQRHRATLDAHSVTH
jgi:FkbM family methyltransferase